jgi:hypothetical protein
MLLTHMMWWCPKATPYYLSWVLIYIATNFLSPIPCISLGIDDFPSEFLPKSTNFSNSIPNRQKLACTPEIAGQYQKFGSRKSPNWLKPAHRPTKAGQPAKAGPRPVKVSRSAGQRPTHHPARSARPPPASIHQPPSHQAASPSSCSTPPQSCASSTFPRHPTRPPHRRARPRPRPGTSTVLAPHFDCTCAAQHQPLPVRLLRPAAPQEPTGHLPSSAPPVSFAHSSATSFRTNLRR